MKKLIFLSIGIIFLGIVVLGLSFWTIDDQEKFFIGDDCSKMNVPLRFVDDDTRVPFECGWSILRSFVRILYLVIYFGSSGVLIFSIKKKSNKFFILSILVMIVDGIIGFYSFIGDAIASRYGSKYCNTKINYNGTNGNSSYTCENGIFFVIVTLNAITFISILILSVLSLFNRKKLFNLNSNSNNNKDNQPSNVYTTQTDSI